jgi:hypothetical protein
VWIAKRTKRIRHAIDRGVVEGEAGRAIGEKAALAGIVDVSEAKVDEVKADRHAALGAELRRPVAKAPVHGLDRLEVEGTEQDCADGSM